MKTKKQKLTLKKATIANLNDLELANVYGGGETDDCTLTCECNSELTDCKQCQIETGNTEEPTCEPWTNYSVCWTQAVC
ncbi:MAG: rSAM-modified peptide [Candidatus Aminicenantes bacterium]|nr:rSAM-modified peptide [Candidatus Aminicenantes bacterium]NIM78766.1 rSAM-modified peptide [Candidatus Aminicenantes bacterium]NIN18021.1 rSAM-modified peptide [Candidatus Aminicenantes bacterium]NIN41921.1 rSAM-modified peptide [Candidatus Aminicenantes bacterium]NIN84676.1 rSAM-modified peptide [Candidatus Aminicenantes bacterium]